jgi:hypothetical protein
MLNDINLQPSIFYNSTIQLECNQVVKNDYIEIPESIENFNQLRKHEAFYEIQSQYITYIEELSQLYYYFTGIKNKDLNLIITQISDNKYTHVNVNMLLYSYKIIRRHLYNIINYLLECKNNHIINDKTSIICAKLADCFDVCFEGFNSKILRIGEYLYSGNKIYEKINLTVKGFIEETIDNLLIKYKGYINIHEKNALFNIVASDFNFDAIEDKYASLGSFDDISISDIICELHITLSRFNICKIITEELYSLFEDIITKIGCCKWFDSYTEDITAEHSFYLEDHFINIVNKYLNIELAEDKLSITNLINLTEKDKMYIADIKDNLHLLCAKYMYKSANFYPKFLKCYDHILAKINKNTFIMSINNSYFYIIKNNNTIPVELSHIEKINPYSIGLKVYISIFIQALEQTFSTKSIYCFFNSFQREVLLFYSDYGYFICQELKKVLDKNYDVKNRVLSALLEAHLKGNSTTNKTCKHFIKNNIINNDLLRYLLVNKIDISSYLTTSLSKIDIFYFVVSLDAKTIENFLFSGEILNQVAINKVRSILYYLFITKRWQLVTTLLRSKLKFYFIESLTKKQIQKALVVILNYRQYDIANHFLLNYVQLSIIDYQKNNILHHLVLGNQLSLLESLAKNIRSDLMRKLLLYENTIGLTPLMMSMVLAENIYYFNIILSYCDDEIISTTNNIKNNAIMLAAQEGRQQCLQKLITKTSNHKLLTDTNIYGYNSLMLAIKNENDRCANIILDNTPAISLKQAEKNQGLTVIHLAILHKSKLIEKLINKADKDTLKILSSSGDSILSTAVQVGEEQTVKLILETCGKLILHKKNANTLNPLMIAANKRNLACFKILFKYADCGLLLKTNNKGNNILMIAAQGGNLECVNFLLQSCKKNTLKKLYKQTNNVYHDALGIARYCNRVPLCFIGRYEEFKKTKKEILSALIKYKPD